MRTRSFCRRALLIVPVAVLVHSPLPVQAVGPDTTLYLTPTATSIDVGASASFDVMLDPGANAVTAVALSITFDPDVLQLESFDTSGFPFSVVLAAPSIDNTAGTLYAVFGVPASTPPAPVTTSAGIGTLTFTGHTAAAASPISIAGASQAAALGEPGDVVVARVGSTVTVEALVAPTASITAVPDLIDAGDSTMLTWDSAYADTCTGTNFTTGGATSGSVTRTPTDTTSYTVTCTNSAGSAADTVEVVVIPADTIAPVISDVIASDVGETAATVTWTTDELATSEVRYGLTNTYGSTAGDTTNLTTAHSVTILDLFPDTTYHFQVVSHDAAGNPAASQDYTLKTLVGVDTTDPVVTLTTPQDNDTISGTVSVAVDASDPDVPGDNTSGVASVTFLVDGTTINVDTESPYNVGIDTTTLPNGPHTLTARATDGVGNQAIDSITVTVDNTVTPPVDETAPVITLLSNTMTTNDPITHVLTFSTDEPATSVLTLSTDAGIVLTITEDTLTSAHTYTLEGLSSKTTYTASLEASDEAGNMGVSDPVSWKTIGKPQKVTNLTARAGSVILEWSPPQDESIDEIVVIRRSGNRVADPDDRPLVTLSPFTSTYTDTTVKDGVRYTYTIYTKSDDEYSDPASATFTHTIDAPELTDAAQAMVKASYRTVGGGGSSAQNRSAATVGANSSRSSAQLCSGAGDLVSVVNLLIAGGHIAPVNAAKACTAIGTIEREGTSATQTSARARAMLTRTLVSGMSGNDVKVLQQALNERGYTVAAEGPGSPGNETTHYGSATETALKRFQCAEMNVCSGTPKSTGYGQVGPQTRKALGQ